LSYILAVERSVGPLIVELHHYVVATCNYPDTPPAIFDSLSAAKALVVNIRFVRTMHTINSFKSLLDYHLDLFLYS